MFEDVWPLQCNAFILMFASLSLRTLQLAWTCVCCGSFYLWLI